MDFGHLFLALAVLVLFSVWRTERSMRRFAEERRDYWYRAYGEVVDALIVEREGKPPLAVKPACVHCGAPGPRPPHAPSCPLDNERFGLCARCDGTPGDGAVSVEFAEGAWLPGPEHDARCPLFAPCPDCQTTVGDFDKALARLRDGWDLGTSGWTCPPCVKKVEAREALESCDVQ